MSRFTELMSPGKTPSTEAPHTRAGERRKSRKLNTAILVGILGVLSLWTGAELATRTRETLDRLKYPAGLDISDLAREETSLFRNSVIESGINEERLNDIPTEVKQGVRRIVFYDDDGHAYSATTTIYDQYTDIEGNQHYILLQNAHASPSIQRNTMAIKTVDGEYLGTGLCLPYDYIGKDLPLNNHEPIRDLLLCDFFLKKSPETITDPIKPIDPSMISLDQGYITTQQYRSYGFPLDRGMTEDQVINSLPNPLIAMFKYSGYKGYYDRFKGEPVGPGGSGSALISPNNKVIGLLSCFNYPKLTLEIYKRTGYLTGEPNWCIEPLPNDFNYVLATFKSMSENRKIPELKIVNYKYRYNPIYLPRSKSE